MCTSGESTELGPWAGRQSIDCELSMGLANLNDPNGNPLKGLMVCISLCRIHVVNHADERMMMEPSSFILTR